MTSILRHFATLRDVKAIGNHIIWTRYPVYEGEQDPGTHRPVTRLFLEAHTSAWYASFRLKWIFVLICFAE